MNPRRLVALLVSAPVIAAFGGCAVAPPGSAPTAATGTVTCDYRPSGAPAKPVDPPSPYEVAASGTEQVTLDLGDTTLTATLDNAAAPCAVNSFMSLALQGYYNDTECHRLSTTGIFILQCGDPTGTGRGGPGYVFNDDVKPGTRYPAGTLAMANSGKDTNGSQFFIVYEDSELPPQYTVFGRLDEASVQEVADRAFQGHDGSNPDGTGRPNATTTIKQVVAG